MKTQNETPQPEAELLTTSEVEQNLPNRTTEDDYIAAMPFICDNVRLDDTRCENIIDTVDDLYAPHGITCGQCFDEYEAEKQRIAKAEAHRLHQFRRVSFKKAQRLRDEQRKAELMADMDSFSTRFHYEFIMPSPSLGSLKSFPMPL